MQSAFCAVRRKGFAAQGAATDQRGPFLTEEWPPFNPPRPQGLRPCPAIDCPCKSKAARAVQRNACQFLLRLSIWLAPMSAWPLPLRGFERNFQRQLVPALQQRLSGKRSAPNRSEDKHRHTVAEMKHRQFGGQGACPLRSLGVPKGGFSTVENTPFRLRRAGRGKPIPFGMLSSQPGGHVISRPASTWKCRCGTLCPACSPMLETTR